MKRKVTLVTVVLSSAKVIDQPTPLLSGSLYSFDHFVWNTNQYTIFSLVSLDSSLVFAMVKKLRSDCLELWPGVFYINKSKKVPLTQIKHGG